MTLIMKPGLSLVLTDIHNNHVREAYSRILTLGKGRADRRMRLVELEQMPMPADERVDAAEYVDVLREAIEARNGWKHILERCSDHQPARRYRLGDA